TAVVAVAHIDLTRADRRDGEAGRVLELARVGPKAAELREECARTAEHLDTVVSVVRDDHVAAGVGLHVVRALELAVAAAETAPAAKLGAGRAEANNLVGIAIRGLDRPIRRDRDVGEEAEEPVAAY